MTFADVIFYVVSVSFNNWWIYIVSVIFLSCFCGFGICEIYVLSVGFYNWGIYIVYVSF